MFCHPAKSMAAVLLAVGVCLPSMVSGFVAPGPSFLGINGRFQHGRVNVAPAVRTAKIVKPSSLRMVATGAEKEVNPFRPASMPYTIIDKLPEEFAWIVPEDGMNVKDRIAKYVAEGQLQKSDGFILLSWLVNFREAIDKAPNQFSKKFIVEDYFAVLAELVRKERKRPHYFDGDKPTGTHYEPFNAHHSDSKFFDYQKFGIDVTRPLIDWENSQVLGAENLVKIKEQLAAGHNVVFCSNHQSESDTHCIFTLLEDQLSPEYGKIARNIVFIAGERVLRDAIVVPFSRGCNLLTVYSKKHIDSEPELKTAKMSHNQRTLKELGVLFHKGGTCMWFAPSGGRDRRSKETGLVELSPFDANSIEMIKQVAEKAGALEKTHFYSMALATHNIFPPPATVGGAFGEERVVNYVPLRLAVSEETIDVPVDMSLDAVEMRKAVKAARAARAQTIFDRMKDDYARIKGLEQ